MLKKQLSAKLIALSVAVSTVGAFAEQGAWVDTARLGEIDFGIICPAGATERIPADGTTLGYITKRQSGQQIEITTRTIPMIEGIGFGVRSANISGSLLEPVTISVDHPVFSRHNTTQDVWVDAFQIDSVNFNYFTFELPFEMQLGTWTFTASYLDQPLYSVSFEIVDPKSVPHLAAVCAGPTLTS